jgi:hypothetical protein
VQLPFGREVPVDGALADPGAFRDGAKRQLVPVPGGEATMLGAGGLGFRCIEPFDTWTMSYDGRAVQTSSTDLIDGKKDGPLVDVSFHVEAKMAVPPWVPSGRAFGYIAYPPRPDGEPTFNEGYIFEGLNGTGDLIPARVVEAPWLTRLQPVGEDASLVLETPSGTVHIDGETILSTHDIYHDDKMYSTQAMKQEIPSFPALQQAGVRYRWDGEETFGMLERSNPLDKLLHR